MRNYGVTFKPCKTLVNCNTLVFDQISIMIVNFKPPFPFSFSFPSFHLVFLLHFFLSSLFYFLSTFSFPISPFLPFVPSFYFISPLLISLSRFSFLPPPFPFSSIFFPLLLFLSLPFFSFPSSLFPSLSPLISLPFLYSFLSPSIFPFSTSFSFSSPLP